MLYENKNFWTVYGSKFISSILQLENIFLDEKEVLTALETEQYNQKDCKLNKRIISMCKAWEEIKYYILYLKTNEQNGTIMDIKPQEYAKIYNILDETGSYNYLFDPNSGTPLLEQLEYLNSKLRNVEDLEEVVDLTLSFSLEHTIENTLGDMTTYFLGYFIIAIMVFKNFGPFLSLIEKMTKIIELRMNTIQDCAKELKSNWQTLDSYKKLKEYLIEDSKSFWATYPELT
ncbi:hypothetical protein [Spiroplasma culicicola]|uniref:Uncharacterized protein n=1 Tax=Spiroplasma culicicola AES-1 TaxID=1276246 RepID=W6A860_9MOLU|nr:hypothetical protein [Spiroplasma culicicola]AHI53075.1 hypothetical protein SCULI_v1c07340 [Spiroplasma culicicola AES-1]